MTSIAIWKNSSKLLIGLPSPLCSIPSWLSCQMEHLWKSESHVTTHIMTASTPFPKRAGVYRTKLLWFICFLSTYCPRDCSENRWSGSSSKSSHQCDSSRRLCHCSWYPSSVGRRSGRCRRRVSFIFGGDSFTTWS